MANEPDAVMLFAAGLGTRMGVLTAHQPKPLIKVAGRALIDHALEQVGHVRRIVVNLHYLPDQIRAHLRDRDDILFSDETDTVLETGGGLRKAMPLLAQDPVFTMNTDAVWTGENALSQLVRSWNPDIMDALLLLVPRDRAIGHRGAGDFLIAPDGSLSRGPGLVYTGAQIIKTDELSAIAEPAFSLNRLWDGMAAGRRLFGVVHTGGWCDVGRPECIPLAEAMLKEAHDVRPG